eukprot:3698734-Amphidinium_carterae.1
MVEDKDCVLSDWLEWSDCSCSCYGASPSCDMCAMCRCNCQHQHVYKSLSPSFVVASCLSVVLPDVSAGRTRLGLLTSCGACVEAF